MIWVVTGVLVYMAVQRLITKQFDVDAEIMLITSGIGVAINLVMGCTLHQHGHSHGGGLGGHGHSHGGGSSMHGHSHGDDGHSHGGHSHDAESQPLLSHSSDHHVQQENINVRAAFIHVVGDFVQSLGVFIAALLIYFKPDWVIVDPICTFLFSILVLFTTVAILRDALTVLMEGIINFLFPSTSVNYCVILNLNYNRNLCNTMLQVFLAGLISTSSKIHSCRLTEF